MKTFTVIAGFWEEDIFGDMFEDIEFCKSFNTRAEAEACIVERDLTSYPICYIEE